MESQKLLSSNLTDTSPKVTINTLMQKPHVDLTSLLWALNMYLPTGLKITSSQVYSFR